jgi:hypothetical protein
MNSQKFLSLQNEFKINTTKNNLNLTEYKSTKRRSIQFRKFRKKSE